MAHSLLPFYLHHIHPLGPVKAVESYVSPEDSLVLEDESGRAPLSGPNISINSLCTGQLATLREQL